VKRFAQRMRADAIASHEQLTRTAAQHIGVGPPVLLDRGHALARDQIAALSGIAFDGAYIRDMVWRGDAAIAVYSEEARLGGEPILARFAADGLPRLIENKELAEGLATRGPR
jgi:predicted outer membrane protein